MQSYCTEMRSLSLSESRVCLFIAIALHRFSVTKTLQHQPQQTKAQKNENKSKKKNREKPSKARKKYCCDEREKQTNSRDKTFVRRMQHAAIFRQMCQLSVVNHLIYLRISSDEIIRRFRTTNDWSIAFSARTATKI